MGEGHESRFAVYCSHSWRPAHVDVNLRAWGEIAPHCEVLVDVPEAGEASPPYYINRIEELLRRSDVFFGVLPHRVEADRGIGGPDATVQASVYSLFEIRLAELLDLPRVVLFERRTGFKPPGSTRPWECYLAYDCVPGQELPEERQWRQVLQPKIRHWLEWVTQHRRPGSYEVSGKALLLVPTSPEDEAGCRELEAALGEAGYDPSRLDPRFHESARAFRMLREAGLVVAKLGGSDPAVAQMYSAAHALGTPGIRLLHPQASLPWILGGHPGGYQHDIVPWGVPEEMRSQVRRRTAAMFRVSPALADEQARHYFASKRYPPHGVFLSHTMKPPNRDLVDNTFRMLKERYVNCFEYHQVNPAGEDWKKALDAKLRTATHFVVLLTEGYETSPVCTYELEEVLKRQPEVTILPFMTLGRSVPHPKLGHLHHRLLGTADPRAEAGVIVDRIVEVLSASPPRPGSG